MGYQPCHDNDKVKLIPLVIKVTLGAKNSQGHHLDNHFHRKESEDAVIQHLVAKDKVTRTQTKISFNNNKKKRKWNPCKVNDPF